MMLTILQIRLTRRFVGGVACGFDGVTARNVGWLDCAKEDSLEDGVAGRGGHGCSIVVNAVARRLMCMHGVSSSLSSQLNASMYMRLSTAALPRGHRWKVCSFVRSFS